MRWIEFGSASDKVGTEELELVGGVVDPVLSHEHSCLGLKHFLIQLVSVIGRGNWCKGKIRDGVALLVSFGGFALAQRVHLESLTREVFKMAMDGNLQCVFEVRWCLLEVHVLHCLGA